MEDTWKQENWFEDDSALQELLYAELDDRRRELFNRVHRLAYGCAILHFLIDHPRELLTIEDIAFHLRESERIIGKSLYGLADLGLIRCVEAEGLAFFGLGNDRRKLRLVQDLFQWQRRWHTRLGRMEGLLDGYLHTRGPE